MRELVIEHKTQNDGTADMTGSTVRAVEATGPLAPVFSLSRPARQTAGFVYNAPHSGVHYPADLIRATRLPLAELRSSEDSLVDRLFAAAPKLGAPLLAVNIARAYVDTNREPCELDAAMFEGPLPATANTTTERVRVGLGTIPGVVAAGRRIYRGKLPVAEALHRIRTVYEPVHAALKSVLRETRIAFGYAVLVDCHSMPSGESGGLTVSPSADFVLGNCFGTSCAPVLTDTVTRALRDLGYRVAINTPYSGGYNTQHYGLPAAGTHALQIEINRAIYMDEATYRPLADFDVLARNLCRLMRELHKIPAAALKAGCDRHEAAE